MASFLQLQQFKYVTKQGAMVASIEKTNFCLVNVDNIVEIKPFIDKDFSGTTVFYVNGQRQNFFENYETVRDMLSSV